MTMLYADGDLMCLQTHNTDPLGDEHVTHVLMRDVHVGQVVSLDKNSMIPFGVVV